MDKSIGMKICISQNNAVKYIHPFFQNQYPTMDPAEIEFLAEKDMVKIVPNFTSNTLYLLEGDIGPFNAGLPLEVPIWLATDLRQRQKCRILQPDWMDIERLEEAKETEQAADLFSELPDPRLFVTANLILDVATSDINKADKIKTIIKGKYQEIT